MKDDQVNYVTTVLGEGKATAKYDRVKLTLTTTVKGNTPESTKEKLKEKIDEIHDRMKLVQSKVSNLEICTGDDSVEKSTTINPNYAWKNSKQKLVGYTGQYLFSFTTNNVGDINSIYETLVGLQEVNVSSPVFFLKNRKALYKEALIDAKKNADALFKDQCDVLNVSPDDFRIVKWSVNYDSGGVAMQNRALTTNKYAAASMASVTMINDDEPEEEEVMSFEVGSAKVFVTIQLYFDSYMK